VNRQSLPQPVWRETMLPDAEIVITAGAVKLDSVLQRTVDPLVLSTGATEAAFECVTVHQSSRSESTRCRTRS
jgi:anti-sigma-K factor RskA